jgi:hypothetical protein
MDASECEERRESMEEVDVGELANLGPSKGISTFFL